MSRFGSMLATAILFAGTAMAEPQHGLSMYGDPALPPNFTHLPYANPDAPRGGEMVFGETSTFDSINPYIQKGTAPYGVRAHVFETLMGRSADEPFTMYGILAESVEMSPTRDWVEFHLNPAATFSDGAPVTVEDVIWSFEILGTQGRGNYRGTWDAIVSVEQTGERSVRFNLVGDNLELPLIIAAYRPILQKADFEGVDFEESSTRVITGSGPYTIGDFEPGRYIEFNRNPDYWGDAVPFNVGKHNFDTIRYEYFGDSQARWQAFQSGDLSINVENDAAKWLDDYSFPAVENGDILKAEIGHERPSGISGFFINTRNPLFQDIRVRDALIHAFNFEWINDRLNAGVPLRITSPFSNSQLAYSGAAEGRELALLSPFSADLPEDALGGYTLPVGTDDLRNRGNLRKAAALLEDAGWTVTDGILRNTDGTAFAFDIMLNSSLNEPVANIYVEALSRLGIQAQFTLVTDSAQYTARLEEYDYDMIAYTIGMSLSPGNEQYRYWGSDTVDEPGERNYAGVNDPAIDAMIDAILNSASQDDFLAGARALDRLVASGRYVIPFWYTPEVLVAHKSELHYPADNLPIYGYWTGFMPDVWWSEAD